MGLDFFIVEFGVFIGLQVNNWNEARTDRDLIDRYETQLVDNIRSDITDIETGIRTSVRHYCGTLLMTLRQLTRPAKDTTQTMRVYP
ncbi:hypothetical protein GCM10009069_23680 [Algimonas arctica]|uniref:Uncharacterized protein n=1 Tax=Algimonas arctica TaxID=1479486 RepID=A0A8J3G385_9PROT|nr:hypothetical protein [Algimonas arctica]GHB00118.1 hypothetical protein GCM10009069_23680 [Algimonas arctica]